MQGVCLPWLRRPRKRRQDNRLRCRETSSIEGGHSAEWSLTENDKGQIAEYIQI